MKPVERGVALDAGNVPGPYWENSFVAQVSLTFGHSLRSINAYNEEGIKNDENISLRVGNYRKRLGEKSYR